MRFGMRSARRHYVQGLVIGWCLFWNITSVRAYLMAIFSQIGNQNWSHQKLLWEDGRHLRRWRIEVDHCLDRVRESAILAACESRLDWRISAKYLESGRLRLVFRDSILCNMATLATYLCDNVGTFERKYCEITELMKTGSVHLCQSRSTMSLVLVPLILSAFSDHNHCPSQVLSSNLPDSYIYHTSPSNLDRTSSCPHPT